MTGDRGSRPTWDQAARARFLAGVPLFETLRPETLDDLAGRFRALAFEQDAFVFFEGTPADAINLLASGRVKVVRELEDGREVILRLIQPGEIFGGAGGWGAETYPATAIALSDAVVLRLAAASFADLIAHHPDFALAMLGELGKRLREAERRIQELQTEGVERRIARTLVRLANKTGTRTANGIELGVPLSRQNLAELTGATLSTVSRVVSSWHRAGILRAGRERITIVAPHRLFLIAEDLEGRESPRSGDDAS